jgi:hypothetical protein
MLVYIETKPKIDYLAATFYFILVSAISRQLIIFAIPFNFL